MNPKNNELLLAAVMAGSMLCGMILAELWHRVAIRRLRTSRQKGREALIAEFIDKQIWQFVSLDEWLGRHQSRGPWEH